VTVLKGPGSLSAAGETGGGGPENRVTGNPREEQEVQVKIIFCTLQTKDSAGIIQEGLNPGALGFSPASVTS